jgi:transcriptional regulator with XRE-family HTH domain
MRLFQSQADFGTASHNYWRQHMPYGYLREHQSGRTIRITMADNISEAEVRATLSKNLKRLRAKKNLSQLALAVEAGLTHNFINDIENGKKWLSPKTLASLATVLETKPHEFFVTEMDLPGQDITALTGYLDNFADDILRWVQDVKGRYLPNIDEDT